MPTDSRITIHAVTRQDVQRHQVEAALAPLLAQGGGLVLGSTALTNAQGDVLGLVGVHLAIRVDLELGSGFDFDALVAAIGNLANEPFDACLENQETGDAEERYYRLTGGPANQIGEFKAKQACADIASAVWNVRLPPGSEGDSLDDLSIFPSMTLLLREPHVGAKDVARVAVDLTGLALDQAVRDRIARLSACIAREIADATGHTITATPGHGAAEWAIAAAQALRAEIQAFDDVLDDLANDGQNAQPPDGDGYNAVYQSVKRAVAAIELRAGAQCIVPQLLDTSEEQRGGAPRG